MTRLVLKAAAAVDQRSIDADAIQKTVRSVIDDVRARGDDAVHEYSQRFDRWEPLRIDAADAEAAVAALPEQTVADIRTVQDRVRAFARAQRDCLLDLEVESQPGVFLGHRHVPVGAVGAYVPGGRYPLTASAHMTIVTAKVAGVPHVVACTPPIRGDLPLATIAAMYLAGADEIHVVGGVQAVAAMALGTDRVGRVDLIAGPGNAYVAEAKRQLFGTIGIDLPAGPTEILIVVDQTADPFVVAVDLLSQAEHGPDSPAVLVSTSEDVARRVMAHVDALLPGLPTNDFAGPAWRDHGEVVVVDGRAEAFAVADSYSSEHVEILMSDPREALTAMRNYGALFLGEKTCVSYGDKVIGTNHVLPTRGAARFTGGLWVGKYLKTVTYQEVQSPLASAELGRLCGRAARVELFEGHARAGDVRAAIHGGDDLPWADPLMREAYA